jgi:hypothetical protein
MRLEKFLRTYHRSQRTMVRQTLSSQNGGQLGSVVAVTRGPSKLLAEFVELLEQLRKDYQYMVQATLSIGYGQTISQAGKALLVAKERGKDQVVQYDESVEQEVQNIKNLRLPMKNKKRKRSKVFLVKKLAKKNLKKKSVKSA